MKKFVCIVLLAMFTFLAVSYDDADATLRGRNRRMARREARRSTRAGMMYSGGMSMSGGCSSGSCGSGAGTMMISSGGCANGACSAR